MRTDDPLIGKVIDRRFEIRARIGAGGMGTVYRAWQQSIGRDVALKILAPAFASDVAIARRFLREARLASQLSHPNTVGMIDFGQSEDGQLFIAMELLRGKNLVEVLAASGKLAFERVVRIGVQLCDALAAAHKQQIIHRDLKLENIILLEDVSRGDFIKILDFGLAKSLAEGERDPTRAGLVVGTAQYIAPEALAGTPTGTANDLYAVGVVLGELITARALWEATQFPELLAHKQTIKPALEGAPEVLRALIWRLTDPDPAARPGSALDVATELGRMLDGPQLHSVGSATKPPPPPHEAMLLPQAANLPELQLELGWARQRKRVQPTKPSPSHGTRVEAPRRWPIIVAIAIVIAALGYAVVRWRGG